MKRFLSLLTTTALALTLTSGAWARATFTIINADGANEGFNDPAPRAPVGGNPGTTLGQQRLIAFTFAANIWGCMLDSDVSIRVRAQFNPLTCTATSGTLGSTGSQSVWRDFPGAPLGSTWFVDSEADALSGLDLGTPNQDMNSTFNSNIGTVGCLDTSPWYLGLDNMAPAGSIELVVVLLHEFGHGLGFASTVGRTTGAPLGGFLDVYSRHLLDNTSGLHWDAMTNAQRLASITNDQNLVWDGPNVNAVGSSFLCKAAKLDILTPPSIAGTYNAPLAAFSACEPNVTAPVELVVDGTAPTSDACEPILNNLAGKIAILDRGTCTFVVKVKAAQNAGAVGCIVVNNSAASPIEMGGADPTIVIPAVMVSQANGNSIKAELVNGVTATIGTNFAAYSGADNAGHLKMYAPNPSVSGSSTSHWDVTARPNLLMEPAINAGLPQTGDMTVPLLHDILWNFNSAPQAACQNIVVQGTGSPCTANVLPGDVNAGSFDINGDAITLTLDPPGPYPSGHTIVNLIASDGCYADTCVADITVDCPIPVKLAALSVARTSDGAVLHWEVLEASDHAGFHVFREENGSDRVKLSTELLSGRTAYDFTDHNAPAGGADYWLSEISRSGDQSWYGPVNLKAADIRPPVLALSSVTPNPFRFQARISYVLPARIEARISIYDAQGRLVKRLLPGVQEAGGHDAVWDGQSDAGGAAPSGIYFVMLQAGSEIRHQKVLLSR